jgi:putative ATPase
MKELGYGADYRYPHDFPGHYIAQSYLPDAFAKRELYTPGELGQEKRIAERMRWWRERSTE